MSNRWKKGLSPFVIFSLLMLAKLYWSWSVIFESADVGEPVIAGLPSIWVVFCLIELFARKRKLSYYMTANVVFTSVLFACIMYYKYFGVIVTYHALQQVGQVTEVRGSVFHLMHAYFLLIFTDIGVLFALFGFRKATREWGRLPVLQGARIGRVTLSFVLAGCLLACLIQVWAGRHTLNEIKQAQQMGILNYEVYAVIADLKKEPVPARPITPEAVELAKGETPAAVPLQQGIAKGRNVIVIQLEAFQNFLLGLRVDGQEVTPNLNRLLADSVYFPHVYQQVGQGNTSDAEFVVNTSLYIPQHGAASDEYAGKQLPGMPRLFEAAGYQALTFHTNDVEFWNRKELYAALGFTRYYDRSFFGDDDIVAFASSDEVLYDKTSAELARLQQAGTNFYAQIISMSSHHPFNIPARKDSFPLSTAYDDTLVGDYLKAQHYTDFAIGQFFDKLKESGVWDNSLIVIYGDHMGLPIYSLTAHEKSLMEGLLNREYEYPDMLNIPLIVTAPGALASGVNEQTGGQSDFMPTIANLTGLSLANTVHFGRDLINTKHNVLPEHYYLPSGSFINDEEIYIPGKSFEDGTVYPLIGVQTKTDEEELRRDFDVSQQLIQLSHEYVDTLPDRAE